MKKFDVTISYKFCIPAENGQIAESVALMKLDGMDENEKRACASVEVEER